MGYVEQLGARLEIEGQTQAAILAAALAKPRLFYEPMREYPIEIPYWACEGRGVKGTGETPQKAYMWWVMLLGPYRRTKQESEAAIRIADEAIAHSRRQR